MPYQFFSPFITFLKNMKIWCNIQVIINPFIFRVGRLWKKEYMYTEVIFISRIVL